jgi:HAE1 family hydrophobic/amphiphilic exporter-1
VPEYHDPVEVGCDHRPSTRVTATLGGAAQDQRDAFNQLGLAMLVAIALVFMIMVGTFRSLVQPLILMVSIPFAATGAVAGLLITDTPLGVPAMVGLLMLIGIVVTNAIVLIDLINQYRRRGEDLRSAIIDGARLRLRPIIMTACATIFALIPMALGSPGVALHLRAVGDRRHWRSGLLDGAHFAPGAGALFARRAT